MTAEPILSLKDLTVTFGDVRAVRGVSISVMPGETVGIVGESGSGKTATFMGALGLLSHVGADVNGESTLFNTEILSARPSRVQRLLSSKVALVSQDTNTSLDPLFTIGSQLVEACRTHTDMTRKAAREHALSLLSAVGFGDPASQFAAFPHRLSGGMRQRAALAIALSRNPTLLIADEPTTALDASIQAQVIELLRQQVLSRRMALVLVTHDLSLVTYLCDRVITMYAGEIVEDAPTSRLLRNARHPYSAMMMRARPDAGLKGSELTEIPGQPPDPRNPFEGCAFMSRCPYRMIECGSQQVLRHVETSHSVRCWRSEELEFELGKVDATQS